MKLADDPAAVLHANPLFPPRWERKPWEFSMTVTFDIIDHELLDLLFFGQSPGPQFPLGEN